MKCLRFDNGGEYCNKEFDSSFSYHGIRREKTVRGKTQENGVLESMNRMIMEHARCNMRLHVGFPLYFWANVVDIVVYLINKVTSNFLDDGIP